MKDGEFKKSKKKEIDFLKKKPLQKMLTERTFRLII